MSYSPDLTQAVRRALYRLRWKLGRAWGDRVVLVGGLAPPFLVPEPASGITPHVGTSDIDLAVGELDEQIDELGDRGPISLRVVGPTTLMALKAQALDDVDKPKHAYDIVWLCDAWPPEEGEANGATALAAVVQASGLRDESFIRESLDVLRGLFETTDSPGPIGYAQTIGGTDDDYEGARLYAHGLLAEFFAALEEAQ